MHAILKSECPGQKVFVDLPESGCYTEAESGNMN